MSDPTFDPRLARLLRTSTDPAVRPYLPRAIAERAIADASARSRRSATRRSWRIHGPRLLLAAALVTGAGAALAASTALAPPVDDARGVIVAVAEPADGSTASAWRVDPATGRADALVTGARFVSLAPDARHIAVVDDAGIRSIDTRTGMLGAAGPGRSRSDGRPGRRRDRAELRVSTRSPGRSTGRGSPSSAARFREACVGRIVAADGSSSGWLPLAGPDPVTQGERAGVVVAARTAPSRCIARPSRTGSSPTRTARTSQQVNSRSGHRTLRRRGRWLCRPAGVRWGVPRWHDRGAVPRPGHRVVRAELGASLDRDQWDMAGGRVRHRRPGLARRARRHGPAARPHAVAPRRVDDLGPVAVASADLRAIRLPRTARASDTSWTRAPLRGTTTRSVTSGSRASRRGRRTATGSSWSPVANLADSRSSDLTAPTGVTWALPWPI